jgi:hypothetical protein
MQDGEERKFGKGERGVGEDIQLEGRKGSLREGQGSSKLKGSNGNFRR